MRKVKNILLYIDRENSVCNFWRGSGVLNELKREGKIDFAISNWKESLITLRKYDIAYFQRPMFAECEQQVRMCKDVGLKVIIDLDDWSEVPETNYNHDIYYKHFELRPFKIMLKLADVVIVTNERMKQGYLRFCDNIKIVPNAINDYVFKQRFQSPHNLVVWRGGESHYNDIKNYTEWIKKVMMNHPDWFFLTIGDRLQEFDSLKNHKHIDRLSIHDYFGFMLQVNPTIVIAPLLKNKFNELKSNIIWQEATISGAVCLSPDFSSCDHAVKYDTSLSFKLEELINNRNIITKNFNRSKKILAKKYYLSKVNRRRLKIINSL